jgi:type II secretory pathway pseudopilin PulG
VSATLHQRGRRQQSGVVLLALLLTIGIGAVAAMAAAESFASARQRENEEELLFIGMQFQNALQSYYAKSPGLGKTMPSTLEQLLQDDRFPNPVRHLRRIYVDPMTGKAEWGIKRLNNRIAGVYSLSTKAPLKRVNFPERFALLEGKDSYADWVFSVQLAKTLVVPAPASPFGQTATGAGAYPLVVPRGGTAPVPNQ